MASLSLLLVIGCAAESEPVIDDGTTELDRELAGKFDEWGSDPSHYFGFDVTAERAAAVGVDPGAAQAGLEDIWSGKGFRNGFPIDQLQPFGGLFGDLSGLPFRKLLEVVAPRVGPEEMFRAYGLVPSPSTRVEGRRDDAIGSTLSLGQSIFQRDDAWLVNNNCFICHAGAAGGRVVAGAANAHLDQQALLADFRKISAFRRPLQTVVSARQWTGFANEREELELNDFFAHFDQILEPSFKHAQSRGDNLGPYAVWMGIPRLVDPERQGMSTLSVGEPSSLDPSNGQPWDDYVYGHDLVTVDPNAWWQRKYRRTSYWYGETASDDLLRPGDRTAPVAAHFAFNFTTPHEDVNETHPEHVQFISNILAFAEQLEAPPFPEALDAGLVQRGAALFHGGALADGSSVASYLDGAGADHRAPTTCATCHGSYAKTSGFEMPGGWTVSYADTCTDASGARHPRLYDDGTDAGYNDLLRSFGPLATRVSGLAQYFAADPRLAPTAIVPAQRGYIAPPLDGVWATAPYLHNGSVPTLDHLLQSTDQRPVIWQRRYDSMEAYDFSLVGVSCATGPCVSIDPARYEEMRPFDLNTSLDVFSHTEDWIAFRAVYDTRGLGRGNGGHTWGYRMNADERRAMLEFLKSLGGPGMTRTPGYEISCRDAYVTY